MELERLEKKFSAHKYDGNGKTDFCIEKGCIPIIISTPHSTNHYREGKIKLCDRYTGAITKYLHKRTGCHIMYSSRFFKTDPNYDEPRDTRYKQTLKNYLIENNIPFLIDLHGSSKNHPFAIELGTCGEDDPTLHGFKFIPRFIGAVLGKHFRSLNINNKEISKNTVFPAFNPNTVTNFISSNTETIAVQMKINALFLILKEERVKIK